MAIWQNGKWPRPNFRVDLRNHGERKLYRSANPDHWQIELDGFWHCANSHWLGTLYETWPLLPGEEQTDVSVPLHEELTWPSKEGKQPLEFRLGKHTVRVALELKGADENRPSLSVVSNPVEIIIERALPGTKLSVEEAVRDEAAFAAVCEAADESMPVRSATAPGVSSPSDLRLLPGLSPRREEGS